MGAFIGSYEDRAIRAHALGKFRDLLAATIRSPAMLLYLDNAQNAAGKINENYARELMELHTLGVKGGYTQTDVQELARILTGLGIGRPDEPPKLRPELRAQVVLDGLFLFNPARHDYGDKQFLGHRIAGAGLAEVDQAVDLLARHPATAHFISAKLAAYFLGDAPPPALVDRMARTFLASDGDIAAVLQTLYASPEFARSLDAGVFKDPVHYVYSSLRLAYAGMPTIVNPRPALNLLRQLGQPLNQRLTPDGYPLAQSDWAGPGQMTARFETARAIAAAPPNFYRDPAENPQQQQQQQQQQQTPQPPLAAPARPAQGLCRHRAVRPAVARHAPGAGAGRQSARRQYLPAGLAGIHAALVPARTTRPRPPRRSSCTVAACSNSWPPPLRAGHRPPLRRAGRAGQPAAGRIHARRLRRRQPAGAGRQRLLLRVAAHHRHPRPGSAPTPRCRWPTAGRCIPRWPPA